MSGESLDTMKNGQAHEGHNQAALNTEKDPEGGTLPRLLDGKSWDEPNGKTGSGKKFILISSHTRPRV